MSDNRKRILEMLVAGKISVDEAFKLLSALGGEVGSSPDKPITSGQKARFLHVVVYAPPDEVAVGKPAKVNVRVPVGLIRAGMKFSSLIPEEASGKIDEALREKGIKLNLKNIKEEDVEELIAALSDLEVDIDEGKGKVRIYSE